MTAFTDAVVNICREEFATFHNGQLKETDQAVFQRVGDYWNKLAEQPDFKVWHGYNGRTDGKFERRQAHEDQEPPMAAAFIAGAAEMTGARANPLWPSAVASKASMPGASEEGLQTPSSSRGGTRNTPKIGDLIARERRQIPMRLRYATSTSSKPANSKRMAIS